MKGNTLTIERNQGQDALNVDLSGITSGLSSTDYQLVSNKDADGKDIAYKAENGTLTLTVQDANNPNNTKTVTISDVASATTLNNVNNQVNTNTTNITNNATNITNLQEADKLNVKYDSEAKNSVTLGGAGSTTPVKLTNVAAGTAGTDAVNFSQLETVKNAEDYVTSGSIADGKITLNRQLGGTVEINGLDNYIAGKDTYVTNATLKGNTLTIERNQGQKALTVDLSSITSGLSSTDYRLVSNTDASGKKTAYTVDASGKLTLKVQNTDGKTENVTIDGIAVVYEDGNLKSTDAKGIWNEIGNADKKDDKTTSIALGKNTFVSVQDGRKGNAILFGNDTYTGGIAIGENSTALNNSVSIGIQNYKGQIGNIDLSSGNYDLLKGSGVATTTVGSNSYSSGSLATNIGAYNIATTSYAVSSLYAGQNSGSVMMGALNSIESYGNGTTSGIANNVIGLANKTNNTNGSIILGAGNEITNSIQSIASVGSTSYDSATEAAEAIRNGVQKSSGGAVLAIGGGNKADYAVYSQLMGVNNTLTGTSRSKSQYDLINGYNNTVKNAKNTTVMGINNTLTDSQTNVVIGDNHSVSNDGGTGSNTIILGSQDTYTATTASDAVILGHNANVSVDGGVALGKGSQATTAAGVTGAYAPTTGADSATWTSTAAAVSVGGNGTTRQITNVAAGTQDTDAVNVAQLNAAAQSLSDSAYKGWNVKVAGEEKAAPVASGSTVTFNNTDGNLEAKTVAGEDGNVELQFNLKDKITIGKTNGNPVTINGEAGTVNGLTNTTWNADKVVSGQAATEDQLKQAVSDSETTLTTKGFGIKTEDGKSVTKKLGETVEVVGDDNVNTAVVDGKVQVGLNDVVTLGNTQGNNVRLDGKEGNIGATGYVRAGDVYVNQDGKGTVTGLTNQKTTYEGFADGSGRAATEEQLKAVSDVANTGWNLTANGADSKTIKPGNTVDFSTAEGEQNLTIAKEDTKDGAAVTVGLSKDLKVDSVTTGDTVVNKEGITIGTQASLSGTSLTVGGKTYIDDKGLNANDQKISHVADGEVSETSKDAVNGSQLHKVQTESTTTLSDGVNTNVTTNTTTDGHKDYSVNLNDNITLGSDADHQIVINGKPGTDDPAISMGGDKFVVGQDGSITSNVKDMFTENNLTFNTEGLTVSGERLGQTTGKTNIKGDTIVTTDEFGNATKIDGGSVATENLTVQPNIDNKLTFGEGGLNVKSGHTNAQVSKEGVSLSVDNGAGHNNSMKLDADQTTFSYSETGAAAPTTTVIKGQQITAGNIKLNGEDGSTITGLTNTEWDANGTYNAGRAATEEQLKQVSDVAQHANQGWNLTVNNDGIKTTNVKPGSTVDFSKAKDEKNLTITKQDIVDEDGNVTGATVAVGLSRDLDVDSVTAGATKITDGEITIGDAATQQIVLNGNGISVGGTTYVTNYGLTGGGNTITNVAAGEADTDAVNVGQLKDYSAKATTTVSEGKNITVTPTVDETDGHTDYNVKLNDTVTLGSIDDQYVTIDGTKGTIWTSGDVTVGSNADNKNIVLHADSQTISGLSNTTTDYENFADGSGRAAKQEQ